MTSLYGGKDALLPHLLPMEEEITTLKESINTTIAWPKDDLVSFYKIRKRFCLCPSYFLCMFESYVWYCFIFLDPSDSGESLF